MDNPGFRLLREAFEKFANKYSTSDIGERVVRSVAAGGRAAVDQSLVEFPKTFITAVAQDFYSLITSQEVSDGISSTIRSFDEEKVKSMLDGMVDSLKDRDTALKVAKQVKDLLAKAPAGDLTDQIDGLMDMAGLPLHIRFAFQAFLSQAKPVLDSVKEGTDEEMADKIVELAQLIPSDTIATMVGDLTREATPERISKQAHDLVGEMPSPKAIADIVHGVGGDASYQLDRITKITSTSEVPGILGEFMQNASDLISDTISKDKTAKKTFDKKGGSFDL